MKLVPRIALAPFHWLPRWRRSKNQKEYATYTCAVVQETPGWLVIELKWSDLRHFLGWRPRFNSMPNDTINVRLDFSGITVHPDMLNFNQSVRIRKGKRREVVPARIARPPNSEIYFLLIGKLILAHVERQFRFNLVTWPLANALPLVLGAGLFSVWGFLDGWQLHKSTDFFSLEDHFTSGSPDELTDNMSSGAASGSLSSNSSSTPG